MIIREAIAQVNNVLGMHDHERTVLEFVNFEEGVQETGIGNMVHINHQTANQGDRITVHTVVFEHPGFQVAKVGLVPQLCESFGCRREDVKALEKQKWA